MEEGKRRATVLQVVCWLAVGVALLPLLWRFYGNLWRKEPYQFYPLAFAGAGFLARRAWEGRPLVPKRGAMPVAVTLLGFGLVLMAIGAWLYSPWVGMMALLTILAVVVWTSHGAWGLKALLPALAMVAITLPPPFNLDVTLTFYLREIATRLAGQVLDLLNVTHIRIGNIIELPERRLFVDEACSGINSVVSTAAACLFYQLWMRRPWYQIGMALPLTLGFVLAGNIFRIFGAAWLLERQGIDLFSHGVHEAVGVTLFGVYLVLIVCVDHLLCFVLKPAPPDPRRAGAARKSTLWRWNEWTRWSSGPPWLSHTAVTALLLLGITFWVRPHIVTRGGAVGAETASWPEHSALSLPESLAGWRQAADGEGGELVETGGLKSRSWRFTNGALVASVSIDYPIKGYHDVGQCYEGAGWQVVSKSALGATAGESVPHIRLELQKNQKFNGIVWFTTSDASGNNQDKWAIKRGFLERFASEVDVPTTFRVQTMVVTGDSLPADARAEVERLFGEVRTVLASELLGGKKY